MGYRSPSGGPRKGLGLGGAGPWIWACQPHFGTRNPKSWVILWSSSFASVQPSTANFIRVGASIQWLQPLFFVAIVHSYIGRPKLNPFMAFSASSRDSTRNPKKPVRTAYKLDMLSNSWLQLNIDFNVIPPFTLLDKFRATGICQGPVKT